MAPASTRIVVGSVLITLLAACSAVGARHPDAGSNTSVGSSGSSGSSGSGTGSLNGVRNTDAGPSSVPNEGQNLDDGK
jgi:hypothetical protein